MIFNAKDGSSTKRLNKSWKTVKVIEDKHTMLAFFKDYQTMKFCFWFSSSLYMQTPIQPKNIECGYYIMAFMRDIIKDVKVLASEVSYSLKIHSFDKLKILIQMPIIH